MLNTPVLFIIFNRPATTLLVFEAIRLAKPKQLFIAADGPRPGNSEEKKLCEEARKIATTIDWDCEIKTLFQKKNLGCGRGVATAITWFFEHVEEGIILEDDCLPDLTFFSFCEQLLNRFKDNSRIMHISGNNFQFEKKTSNDSYYFSIYTHNWGWATWRRAWRKFQFNLTDLDQFIKTEKINKIVFRKKERNYFLGLFEELRNGKEDIWDIQWLYAVWKNEGLAVLPNVNLVSNIGFGKDATHTFSTVSRLSNINTKSIKDLRHPNKIIVNKRADQESFVKVFFFTSDNILIKIKKKLFSIFITK